MQLFEFKGLPVYRGFPQ